MSAIMEQLSPTNVDKIKIPSRNTSGRSTPRKSFGVDYIPNRYSSSMLSCTSVDNILQKYERLSSSRDVVSTIYRNGSDLAWESALTEVLAVLKIQYRADIAISSFLASEENIRQLKYSSVARMEYNRRCIHEDCSHFAGAHSAPRARRIAKDVAIDYIRRYLDGETDRIDMVRKISTIANERDAAIEHSVSVECNNNELRREKDTLILENADIQDAKAAIESSLNETQALLKETVGTVEDVTTEKKVLEMDLGNTQSQLDTMKSENSVLREDLGSLRSDIESARGDNAKLRGEIQDAWRENSERRDEISRLKTALEKQRIAAVNSQAMADSFKVQNEALQHQNTQMKENNLCLRDENNVLRAREEEMRTLVTVQMNLLSPEKQKSDVLSAAPKIAVPDPAPVEKAASPVQSECEGECEEE